MHEHSITHRPRYYTKSPTVQNALQPIPDLMLRWGDWEMGTAISCTKCSQVAGLIQTAGRSSMNVVAVHNWLNILRKISDA